MPLVLEPRKENDMEEMVMRKMKRKVNEQGHRRLDGGLVWSGLSFIGTLYIDIP